MKHLKIFTLTVILLFMALSCSSDDTDEKKEENVEQLVRNFVTPELMASLKDLGFNFNDGNDHPDISGTFHFSKHVLVASNTKNDPPPGAEFASGMLTFSDLNPEKRTFTFLGTEDGTTSVGDGSNSFYSGRGNDFSAYVKYTITYKNRTAICLMAISGTITEKGITNAQDAILMLDNKGNPDGTFILNGQGRLFKDLDGTAERK